MHETGEGTKKVMIEKMRCSIIYLFIYSSLNFKQSLNEVSQVSGIVSSAGIHLVAAASAPLLFSASLN